VKNSEYFYLESKYNNCKALYLANICTCEIRLAITNKNQNILAIWFIVTHESYK
jgi:hypothetical protein